MEPSAKTLCGAFAHPCFCFYYYFVLRTLYILNTIFSGLTCRLDVTELFEKRVKSRFSHRQIFLFPSNEKIFCRIKELLSYTGETNKMYAEEIRHWNKHIESLLEDKKLKETINTFSDVNVDEKNLKNILVRNHKRSQNCLQEGVNNFFKFIL